MLFTEYKIQFASGLTLNRPLLLQHAAYLDRFLQTRRAICSVEHLQDVPDPLREAVGLPLGPEGAYFVGIDFDKEHIRKPIVLDAYKSPQGQPNPWCRWRIDPDGMTFRYTATYNLYDCFAWLQYLLDHFLTPWDYQFEGEVSWQGDDEADRGKIIVQENVIEHRLEQVVGKEKQLALPDEPIFCVHHDAQETKLVCAHLAGQGANAYNQYFTGSGQHYHRVCLSCASAVKSGEATIEWRQICWRCYKELETDGDWEGIVGQPEVLVHPHPLSLIQQHIPFPLAVPVLALQPIDTQRESIWVALTVEGDLVSINLSSRTMTDPIRLPESKLDMNQQVSFHLASGGDFAAIVNTHGQYGIVVNLSMGKITMQLARDTYHIDQSCFPVAFFVLEDRLLLVHGTLWNRLDISDPRTGELISTRPDPPHQQEQPLSEHYLNYFHASLSVSPGQRWIADSGWIWAPIGQVVT